MIKKNNIYSKLLMMVTYSGVILFFLFITIIVLHHKQAKVIFEESQASFTDEVNSLIRLKARVMQQITIGYAYWDELANVLHKNRAEEWLNNNISPILQPYNFDYVALFDKNYRLLYKYNSDTLEIPNITTKEALIKLSKERTMDYFHKTEYGFLKVFSASIHPTNDIYLKETDPSGYLFFGKLWKEQNNPEFFKSTYSKFLEVLPEEKNSITKKHSKLYTYYKFKDWEDKEIGGIWFIKDNDISRLYNQISIYMFFIMLLSMFFMWVTLHFSIRKWVINPLILVEKILKSEDKDDIAKLQGSANEFSKIALLFKRYINQKEELELAKERAEKADMLKSQFIANVSHEIRTPMNGIIGFTELLKEPTLTEQQKAEYIEIIQNSGERMMTMINDLINISKLESGQEVVKPSYFSIKELIQNTISFFLLEAKTKGISIECSSCSTKEDIIIHTDREKLYGILNNIIKNAIKYSNKGTISCGYEQKDNFVQFFVKDQGIGISQEAQSSIFNRFYQADSSLNRNYEGVGLGLSISKAYVELMGGEIWVESEVEKGTTFYFTLPNVFIN